MILTPIDPRTVLSATKLDLSPDAKRAKDLKSLRQSTREFEALFINEMYKAMRKNVPDGGLIKKDMASNMYQEMIDMELARSSSKGTGIGLGQAMYDQLKYLIENKLD